MDDLAFQAFQEQYKNICRLCRCVVDIKIPLHKQEDGTTVAEIASAMTGLAFNTDTILGPILPSNVCVACYGQLLAFKQTRMKWLESSETFANDYRQCQLESTEEVLRRTLGAPILRRPSSVASSSMSGMIPLPIVVKKETIVQPVTPQMPEVSPKTPTKERRTSSFSNASTVDISLAMNPVAMDKDIQPETSKLQLLPSEVSEIVEVPDTTTDWKCQFCSRRFETRQEVFNHQTVAHPDETVICIVCTKKFRSYHFLAKHIDALHAETRVVMPETYEFN